MRVLVDTQLSNYTRDGRFVLACDSGWQMCASRIRELLALDPELTVDVTVARSRLDSPEDVTPAVALDPRVRIVELPIEANALATRYDFAWSETARALGLSAHRANVSLRYDVAYVNDPMRLRALRALLATEAGYVPRCAVHSHFVDLPSKPKFPTDASLWWGQLEAAARADWNFWQCESTLSEFLAEARHYLSPSVWESVRAKSSAWDDGYSISEIREPVDLASVRPELRALKCLRADSVIVFVPNRVGGGKNSDYTRCGAFLREHLPKIRAALGDSAHRLIVVAGNPSLKFSNAELASECGVWPIGPDPLTRNELRWTMLQSDFVVGLYDSDAYGSTASREAIELGAHPIWIDCNEYASIAREAGCESILARADFSDLSDRAAALILPELAAKRSGRSGTERLALQLRSLQGVVRARCAVESTAKRAYGQLIGATSSWDPADRALAISIGPPRSSKIERLDAQTWLQRCSATGKISGVAVSAVDELRDEPLAAPKRSLARWPWLVALVESAWELR